MDVCAGLVSEMCCGSLIVLGVHNLYIESLCLVLCVCVFVVWYDYK